jgi:hypothetical protein
MPAILANSLVLVNKVHNLRKLKNIIEVIILFNNNLKRKSVKNITQGHESVLFT